MVQFVVCLGAVFVFSLPREGSAAGAGPNMEDESNDKKPRPRSLTISYRTDVESVGSNMDDRSLDTLDDID